MGGDVVRRGQPGSPGSGGASPSYLRRACHEQASARRMGLWRQSAPYLDAYGVNPGLNGAKLGDVRGLSFAPKGHENLAQGFNPGNRTSPAKSPERAPDRMRQSTHLTNSDLSPLQHLQPGGPGVFPEGTLVSS
jgi:hypothetical protein